MKKLIKMLPVIASLMLMVGCASDFQSTDSGSSASSVDTSSVDSFNETQQRINDQMAVDAANAAAAQQFNDSMAATQLFENQHNAEFIQNGGSQ